MPAIKVYGAPWCPDCKRAKRFLGEHRVAYEFIDIDADSESLRYVEQLQNGGRTIPTVVFPDGSHLLEPSDGDLARKLGLKLEAGSMVYDLAIVGGGPAGLAAALYAAREGIASIVIDRSALGGNAGVTERIDNYPGFPEGVAGAELADRFVQQARRYQVELLSAVAVEKIMVDGDQPAITLASGQEILAGAVLVATGSTYRRLGAPGEEGLVGAGVHFCATCDGPFYRGAEELLVIGGGNSGLEEGLFLTQFAKKVRLIEHGPELKGSRLLQDKVRHHPQFEIHTNTEVVELKGADHLEAVVVRDRQTGETTSLRPAAAFVFIGLDPNTAFLGGAVRLNQRGFIETDAQMRTDLTGVFAAGDVRAGSTKQLGSAVGEGITALLMIRHHLESRRDLRVRVEV